MENLVVDVLAYPVLPFTLLVGLVVLYWVIAATGFLGVDTLDVDTPDLDVDAEGLEGFAGLLMKLGLNGVPVTIVVTVLSLIGWFLVCLISVFTSPFIIGFITEVVIGTPVLIAALYLSIKFTAVAIIPLRKFFKSVDVHTEKTLLGQTCIVRTTKVNETFGEATYNDGGAGLILKVRAPEEKGFKHGDKVVLLEHLEHEDAYRVVSEDEFKYGH
jgi:hypothetical protein